MRLSALACACLGAFFLAAGASAATPRVALFDLRTDLAQASRNAYGDIHVTKSEAALAKRAGAATLVRCAGTCTFGKGWLAFAKEPAIASGDIASARAYRVRRSIWAVSLELTPRGVSHWTAFSRRAAQAAKERGLPDALVLAVDGSVAGQPLANQIVRSKATLRIVGLTRSNAVRTAAAIR